MKNYFIWQKNNWDRFREVLPEYYPSPHTGKLWLDIVYLILLIALQVSVLRTITGAFRVIDLITPWFAISVLRKRPVTATVYAVFAGFILESQYTLPMGTYFCAYWIISNLIVQVRPALSWRYSSSWLALFGFASLFVAVFELFMVLFISGKLPTDPMYFGAAALRILVAIAFGMVLCRQWLKFDAEEPVPT